MHKSSDVTQAMAIDSTSGPLFVVGIWRSGTSLLYTLLNQHPQIALLYEGELPVMRPLFAGGRAKSDWLERWEFWNQGASRHGIDGSAIAPGLDIRAATEAVCKQYAERKNASIWGCKSPQYCDCLPQLAREFPNAKFIVIWRDSNAICSSIVRAAARSHYFARRGMILRALRGLEELKRGCDELVRKGVPVHQFHYEALVRDSATELTAICRFLKIPFDPRMLSLENADRSAIYLDEHHSLVNGKGIVSSAPRPDVLPPSAKRKIQRYLRRWKDQSGVPVDPSGPPNSGTAAPGFFEIWRDRILFRCLARYDDFVLFLYSFLPLWVLSGYRSLRNRTAAVGQLEQTS
jgi:Sulfotransferase family